MKPGFLFGTFARSFRLGLFLFCLSGFIAAGTLKAADSNVTIAPSAKELLSLSTGANGQAVADSDQLPWLAPYIEGNLNAPLQITIYFTPFCKDCATSYAIDHPFLQKYIDQNLVRVRYQDISYDEPTRRTVALLHCLPQEHYLDNLTGLYNLRMSSRATQETVRRWADGLRKKYNLTEAAVNMCMNDQRLLKSRNSARRFARTYMGVRRVPAYLFGKSQFRLGNRATPEEFNALLDKMVSGLKPAPTYQQPARPAQEAPEQPGQEAPEQPDQ